MKMISKWILCALVVMQMFCNCNKRIEDAPFTVAQFEEVGGLYHRVDDVQFIDTQTGIMLVYGGTLLKTTDGGLTWNPIFSAVRSFSFPQRDTLYAITPGVSPAWVVNRSTDGGATWVAVSQLNSATLPAFYCGQTGYAMAAIPPSTQVQLVRTTDAGVTWSNVGTYNGNTKKLGFTSYSMGYMLNDAGDFLQSADAGLTWTAMLSDISDMTGMSPNGICYVNQDGIGIVKTSDYGSTWDIVWPLTSNGVAFYNETVYVLRGNGFIVSQDGGDTWKDYRFIDIPDQGYNYFDFFPIDEHHVLLFEVGDAAAGTPLMRATFP